MGQLQPVARGPRTVSKPSDHMTGPTVDEMDPDSIDSIIATTNNLMREDYLQVARMSVLKDAIAICYKQHGPNHAATCRPLYIEYLRELEKNGVTKINNVPDLQPERAQEAAA